jgi:hypothetical protein
MIDSCKGLVVPDIPLHNPTAGAPFNEARVSATIAGFKKAGCDLPIAKPTPPPTPPFVAGEFMLKKEFRAKCATPPKLQCNTGTMQAAQMLCEQRPGCLWFSWSGPNGGQKGSTDAYPNCVFMCDKAPVAANWLVHAWKKGENMNYKGWVLGIKKGAPNIKSWPGLFPKLDKKRAQKKKAALKKKNKFAGVKDFKPMASLPGMMGMGLSLGNPTPVPPTPSPTPNATKPHLRKAPAPHCATMCMPVCLPACVSVSVTFVPQQLIFVF